MNNNDDDRPEGSLLKVALVVGTVGVLINLALWVTALQTENYKWAWIAVIAIALIVHEFIKLMKKEKK